MTPNFVKIIHSIWLYYQEIWINNCAVHTAIFVFICYDPRLALCFIFRKIKHTHTVSKFHTIFRITVFVI